jgi:hypothetical protein
VQKDKSGIGKVAQVVESLTSKLKVLSSNPQTPIQRERETEKERETETERQRMIEKERPKQKQ